MSDNLRTIYLDGIISHSNWLKYSADSIESYVRRLTHTPPYETMAEAAMNEAESALQYSLTKIREMKAAYKALPEKEEPS